LAAECNISLDAKPERDLKAEVLAMYADYPVFKLMVDIRVEVVYQSETFTAKHMLAIAHYVHLAEFEKFGG
jgi:hypothetical protein